MEVYQLDDKYEYLKFTINLLDILQMWPSQAKKTFFLKKYGIIFLIAMSILPLKSDVITAYYDNDLTFGLLVEQLIAISALYSVLYCSLCFLMKKYEVKSIVEELHIFEKYTPYERIIETDKTVIFYTKCFIIYGIIGNVCYALSPVLTYKGCHENRSYHMVKYGVSCGLIARYVLPFKYDYYPMSAVFIVEEFIVCALGTVIIMTITMLLSGLLMHCTTHLQHLKNLILQSSTIKKQNMQEHINYCVKFHTEIIEYTDKINNAFSVMMLLHIWGTGFIISVLGFAILMENELTNSFRFVMHLTGWFGMLFIVCYYGQTLMDQSLEITVAIYETLWYAYSGKVRESICLLLLRSQRPLGLKAAGMSMMSYATFLGVLSTSYSYFTLLLKIRPSN